MGIVEEDIAAVRGATDLVALVSQYTQGKQVGRRFMAICPFHAEKSGSFSVNREDGLFHCFGCQKSGDAITFVREIEHLDFAAAVEWLAGRAGMALRYTDTGEGEDRQRRKRLYDAMGAAVEWYHDRLLTGADAGAARGYLRSRGLDGETVRRYRIGWAPSGWDELVSALGVPEDVLVATGLGFRNRNGRATDAFRGRVLFPIFDVEDRPVAFGGRVLPGEDGPKYKNSPSTKLYDKSRVLYALNWHKREIVQAGEVLVCEGYTDVIGFARAGLPRAVATCGTAFTEDHARLLSRFAKRIVLAFDADAAGQGAADKFAEWERRYELEVCVADLPPGSDPGDLGQRDPERLARAVAPLEEWRFGAAGAKPYLAFRLDRVLGAADLRTVEGRARAAAAGVDVLRDHPNELVRDSYLMRLADHCRVDADALRDQLRRGAPANRRGGRGERAGEWAGERAVDRRSGRGEERHPAEVEALVLLVLRREEMLGWLDDALFIDGRHLAVWHALVADADLAAALDRLHGTDPGAAEVLARVAVTESDAEPADVGALLLGHAARRLLRDVEAEARISSDPLSLDGIVTSLKLGIEQLREPTTRHDAAVRLLELLHDDDGALRR